MRLFGYARVSTHKQSLDIQINKLIENGVRRDRICTDMQSGSTKDRPGLNALLMKVEDGDQVLVCKLDRLGRNNLDMLTIIDQVIKKNVHVRFLDDGISTNGPMGKMTIQILSAVAEAERERILERINEGKAAARENGVKFGRKPSVPVTEILDLHKTGMRPADIVTNLTGKVSRASVFRVLKDYKDANR